MPDCRVPCDRGERQNTLCQAVRILYTTGQEVTLAQVEHHAVPAAASGLPYFDQVEQVQRLGDLPGPRIGQTQSGHNPRQIERDIRGTALGEGVFEPGIHLARDTMLPQLLAARA